MQSTFICWRGPLLTVINTNISAFIVSVQLHSAVMANKYIYILCHIKNSIQQYLSTN